MPGFAPVETANGLSLAERMRLIRDGLINYSGVLVSGVVAIAVVPIMLDRLGTEAYGLWVAVLAFGAVLAEIDFGLSTIVTREIAADPHCGRERTPRLVAGAAVGYLILAVVGGVLVASLGLAIDSHLQLSHDVREIVPFVFIMGGVLSIGGRVLAFCIALLYGWRRFARANALIAAVAVLGGAGTVIILLRGGRLEAVAAWQAASMSLVAAAALVNVVRLRHAALLHRGRPSWRMIRSQVRFGLASQLLTASVNLLWFAGPVLVGSISGSRLVASFDVGRKFPLALSSISWRSSEAFFPIASREGRVGSLRRKRDVLDAITRWNLILVLPFSVVLWVLAPDLLAVWLGTPPPDATIILRLLAAAVFADALGLGALHILWAQGRMRSLLGILATTTVAGLMLAGVLLWQVGVVGVAIALLSAMAVRSILLLRAVARAHGVQLPLHVVTAGRGLLLPLGACISLALALRELIDPGTWIGLAAVVVIALVGYLLGISIIGREEERAFLRAAARAPALGGHALYRRLRRALRRVGPLRSAWYLVLEAARMAGPGARPHASRFDRVFAMTADPWDYSREQECHLAALRMLDTARAGRRFASAIEIGCAEGMFTELLVPRCEKLKAVDISAVALARARVRLARCETVSLEQWDVMRDRELGKFDLVVAMDVLDYFLRPGDLRRVQARIRDMLLPGAHLLVTTTKQSEVFETARWRRRIPRGRMINESFARLPGLRLLESQLTAMHAVTVYVCTDG